MLGQAVRLRLVLRWVLGPQRRQVLLLAVVSPPGQQQLEQRGLPQLPGPERALLGPAQTQWRGYAHQYWRS